MADISVRTANLASIKVGELEAKFSRDGTRILRYFIDFWHNDLGLHKELSAPEIYLLQGKVDALMASWDKKLVEHQRRASVSAGKEVADDMTLEANQRLDAIGSILSHTLSINDGVNWESLKDRSAFKGERGFPEPMPRLQQVPQPPFLEPRLTFMDTLLFRRARKREAARLAHEQRVSEWRSDLARRTDAHERDMAEWNIRKAEHQAQYERDKQSFQEKQATDNALVDALAKGVAEGEARSVIEHATLVLERSNYGDLFEKSYEVDYSSPDKTLMIEYELPSPDDMPTLKAVRFTPATGELKEVHISERERKANFELACYQICLRTIHEVIEADEWRNIENVLFNGITTYVDRTTGRDTTTCIMSVLVKRSEFETIDLCRIDPKACFKSLKGVSASSLAALAPIPPVMEMNKEDRRFIDARNTVDTIDTSTNLAAMDWEDFEHLVRELFEKEFASRGGEVKITQSSADGGVDAVAFDPDPITGGKIVIQAKRYTRTVGVSAVRDLFGTMQHEGASRGILITTADYGPDAHGFASGKPITLFTGSNLLYLLEKHGYRAKIDLKDARAQLNLRAL
jgi:restriction system protein